MTTSIESFGSSTFTTLPVVIASLFGLIAVTFVIRKLSDKKKYHPCAGTVLNHVLHFRKLHHYMTDLARKHKTYRLISPFRNEIYTSDPANVEYILKTNFPNYGKGWYNYTILNDLMGDGIVTVDGERWKYQRKVSSYEFSTKNLRDFSVAVFRRNAEKLAVVVSDAAAENKPFDIQHLFLKSTMDTIFKVGFGVELDSVFGAQEGAKFAHAFTESSEIIMWRYADMLWRIKRFFSVGTEARLKKDVKVIDKFMYKLIRAKISKLSKSDSSVKKEDLLSRFLELNATDPKYLRDITFNFLHAGRDTTAATLTWFMYRMCMHPHIQEKVAREVKEAAQLKDTASVSEFAATVTEDHVLDKMQYLHAALSETLRLHPAVPVDGKICFSDDTLPDGYSVKKGDMIAYQPYAMGRMKYNWGEDAEEYRPERWIDEDGEFRPESPSKFTTFQVKLNADGSLNDEGTGHGGVIRNSHGEVLATYTGSGDMQSVIYQELKAIAIGLELCYALGYHKVEVESDSLAAVKIITKIAKPPWTCSNLEALTTKLAAKLSYCSFSHVLREANKPADLLAGLKNFYL